MQALLDVREDAPGNRTHSFDDLVALIYRGPLEPTPWRGFLRALCERLGCRNAAIVLRLSRKGLPPTLIWAHPPRVTDAEARRIQTRHAEFGNLDPLRNVLNAPGAIYTLDEVIARDELQHNQFYREVLAPYGFERMLGMYIAEDGGWEGNVGVTNPADAPDFGEADKKLLLGLRRHLEQALGIFALLKREETELHALIDALDRLTICTFILDAQGQVIRTNRAARRLLAREDVTLLRDDRLVFVDRAAGVEFRAILDKVRQRRSERGASPLVEAIRVGASAQEHIGVLVRSIDSPAPYSAESGPATIVYIAEGRNTQPIERLVTQLFDLTPSEAQLATLVATGFSLVEAAERLELTENTVRTYCKVILNKVGVSRQADLVRIILRSVAVLG